MFATRHVAMHAMIDRADTEPAGTTMSETVLRYIKMLEYLPRHTSGITVAALHAKLSNDGFKIDRRSVERDLGHLSALYSITSTESRPSLWHWAHQAPQMSLPGLDPATALTHELVARYLTPLLPRRLMAALEPQFAAARHVLDDLKVSPMGRWASKIAVVPQAQPLLPPDVASDVADVVYESLLNNRRFEVSYRAAEAERPKRYPLNPLGLVLYGSILYLVGTAKDYTDPCIYALHRMSKAIALDEPAIVPDGFDLNSYVQEDHAFEQPYGGEFRLELRVNRWLAHHLGERRLAFDQTLLPIRGSDLLRLQATVADTAQLRWWLRSHGAALEVLKPAKLRREMAAEFVELAKTYQR
jgi:predicted DNA-binding transcriptional regulator YafY